MVDVRKRLVRDLKDAQPGIKQTAAVRLLDHAARLRPDPPQAWARFIAEQNRGVTYWKVEYRPVGGEWGTRYAPRWIQDISPRLAERLREALEGEGWTYPGPWPNPPDDKVLLPLWRNELGQREDQAKALYQAVGKTYHTVQDLYAAAVADALERAGVTVADYWGDPNEPRELTIELAHPPDGYEAVQVGWREERGWYWVPFSDAQAEFGDFAKDLPCAFLALPGDVAAAVLDGVTSPDKPATEPCPWTPPDDYQPYPNPPDDFDYSLELERGLAAYHTHPANQ